MMNKEEIMAESTYSAAFRQDKLKRIPRISGGTYSEEDITTYFKKVVVNGVSLPSLQSY